MAYEGAYISLYRETLRLILNLLACPCQEVPLGIPSFSPT
ncbi:hypothetical protein Pan216_50130 [Planctomycetes bacterium Pan216]|uniref:Uncharacterized protein n=1 Tax=Kolteria novifilia TaxID=2527975 RepID=A0A518BAV8_9BACT|nr:hypothetical protein Pan216_50130 [Planctomycetes bacterium Pan216]